MSLKIAKWCSLVCLLVAVIGWASGDQLLKMWGTAAWYVSFVVVTLLLPKHGSRTAARGPSTRSVLHRVMGWVLPLLMICMLVACLSLNERLLMRAGYASILAWLMFVFLMPRSESPSCADVAAHLSSVSVARSSPGAGGGDMADIVLLDAGESKPRVGGVLRRTYGLSFEEALVIMVSTPMELSHCVPIHWAADTKSKLEAAGATVDIRRSG